MPIFLVKPQWVVTLIATLLVACDLTGGYNPLGGSPAPPTGTQRTLTVVAITSGANPDTDGYQAVLDNGAPQQLGLPCPFANSACASFPVIRGDYTVALQGLAGNCTTGDNPRVVQVAGTPGSSNPRNLTIFMVDCP